MLVVSLSATELHTVGLVVSYALRYDPNEFCQEVLRFVLSKTFLVRYLVSRYFAQANRSPLATASEMRLCLRRPGTPVCERFIPLNTT